MKKDVRYVSQERVLEAAAQLQIPVDNHLASFYLVGKFGTKGPRVYVPKTKTVGRIDLNGFEVREAMPDKVRYLGGESFGGVKEQLLMDSSLSEEQILGNFLEILAHMASLPEFPKRAKGPRAGKKGASTPEPTEEEVKEARKRRARLLAKVAAEKNVRLSPEAEELVAAEMGAEQE